MSKISRLLSIMMLILLAAVFALPTLAQDTPTLNPVTEEGYGIQALAPEGWTRVGAGLYARASTAADQTLLALQSAPVSMDDLWASLLPQFGLTAVPDPVGTISTDAFDWTLYEFDVTAAGSFKAGVGIAEQDGTSYLVLLYADATDYDALHESVFTPALESVSVLEVSAEPVPYLEEEVTFTNGDITLAGTLTLPDAEGQHPAVVLMTGSGAQDRDEQVAPGFRIFAEVADALTRAGVAVLRFDDRGVGGSTGVYNDATIQDLASDGKAGVAYLQSRDDINVDQIGVLGHSEGGAYASMLGADPDSGVAFIISLAGVAVNGEDVLLRQNELIYEASGAPDELLTAQIDFLKQIFPLVAAGDWDATEQATYDNVLRQWELYGEAQQTALGGDAEAYARQSAAAFRATYASEWFRSMLAYDPGLDWAQTTVPVLAIFGELDVQVDDEQNIAPLQEALEAAGNTDFKIVVVPTANHLFQSATTGGLEEYAVLPPHLMPELMPIITEWVLDRVDVVS